MENPSDLRALGDKEVIERGVHQAVDVSRSGGEGNAEKDSPVSEYVKSCTHRSEIAFAAYRVIFLLEPIEGEHGSRIGDFLKLIGDLLGDERPIREYLKKNIRVHFEQIEDVFPKERLAARQGHNARPPSP